MFPLSKIVLYGDLPVKESWLRSANIDFFKHSPNLQFDSVFRFGQFEEKFRKGYWKLTLERLISINTYHSVFSTERILHVESDVIIFPNFPLSKLEGLRKLAWPMFSMNSDIGSLIYSPNSQQSRKLAELLISEVKKCSASDMELLFRVRTILGENFQSLPISHKKLPELMNKNSKIKHAELQSMKSGVDIFDGIFDGLAFGSWIGGFDPRNRFGVTKVHTRDIIDSGVSFVDPSNIFLEINSASQLHINSNGVRIPIYNLHIHSKNLKLFSSGWERELIRLLKIYNGRQKIIAFQPKVLLRLIIESFQNRTLKDFLLNIPFIKRFRT